jgi:hypothetical protein
MSQHFLEKIIPLDLSCRAAGRLTGREDTAMLASLLAALVQEALTVDAAFPGGNAVVEKIEGDVVSLHQDLRDTEGHWFYWSFRVRGAAGRTLTFRFTNGDVFTVLGPAVSADGGETWSWLGKDSVRANSFRYSFPANAKETRFCLSIPYLEKDLQRFLGGHARSPHLRVDTLCETNKGRKVERVHAGRLDGAARHRILQTARHHACDMIASWSLQGILEAALADDADGRWFRENVEILVIPFVDKDGVEDGDQGKNRKPRDHNRDYDGESLYPTTRALREFVPRWSEGRLRIGLDMHCPALRGAYHETIYFVGSKEPENWARTARFSEILESVQTGPLTYKAKNNLPYGKSWNTDASFTKGQTCGGWARTLPGIHFAGTIEIPYANADGQAVTADGARALGRDLARAARRTLADLKD